MNKNRALLLDRDGVINIDHGYVGTVDRFAFVPGLFPFLRAARGRGYLLAVITNQSGVARGMYSQRDYQTVTAHMTDALRREKIDIDLTLACFEHPDATVPVHARQSFWRKPNPGMVLEAIRRLDLDPARSAFIGDSMRDMTAAVSGSIGQCFWLTSGKAARMADVTVVSNFDEILKKLI